MMLLRPLLVKKIACGLGKTDRFKSIYAALYFFPILTVLQAVGGGLLCKCPCVLSKETVACSGECIYSGRTTCFAFEDCVWIMGGQEGNR